MSRCVESIGREQWTGHRGIVELIKNQYNQRNEENLPEIIRRGWMNARCITR